MESNQSFKEAEPVVDRPRVRLHATDFIENPI